MGNGKVKPAGTSRERAGFPHAGSRVPTWSHAAECLFRRGNRGVDVCLRVGSGDEEGFKLAARHVDASLQQAPKVLRETGCVAFGGSGPVVGGFGVEEES